MGGVLSCKSIHKKGLPKNPRKWNDDDIEKAAGAMFDDFDTNNDAVISVSELEEFFKIMNQDLSDFDIDTSGMDHEQAMLELMNTYKIHNDDVLEFDEFLPLFKQMLKNVIKHDTAEKKKLIGLERAIAKSFADAGGVVRCLIIGLNYEGSDAPLTGIDDCKDYIRFCERAGVEDITELYDDGSTEMFPYNYNIVKAIKDIGARCQPHDMFLFFYAGHGTNVPDADGDEDDGLDEAFCTTDVNGDITMDSVLVDDNFAAALHKYIPVKCRIMVFTDCCHSGSIVDIDSFDFKHELVHFSAALDDECAEECDDGGGALTFAMKKATEHLDKQYGKEEYSVGEVYNLMTKHMHGHNQTIGIMHANCDLGAFPWPLPEKGATTGWHLHME